MVLGVWGRSTDPLSRSYDPALAQQPGILFSILARDAFPIRRAPLPVLAQLGMGCSNPLSNNDKLIGIKEVVFMRPELRQSYGIVHFLAEKD